MVRVQVLFALPGNGLDNGSVEELAISDNDCLTHKEPNGFEKSVWNMGTPWDGGRLSCGSSVDMVRVWR
jgi:hypothetical protein